MGKCKNCRWFRTKVWYGDNAEKEMGICDNADTIREIRLWRIPGHIYLPDKPEPLVAEMNEQIQQGIRFEGEFGCVHFESRAKHLKAPKSSQPSVPLVDALKALMPE